MQFWWLMYVLRVWHNDAGIKMTYFLRRSLYSPFPIFSILYRTKENIILTLKLIQFIRVELGIKWGLSIPDRISIQIMREDSFICGI